MKTLAKITTIVVLSIVSFSATAQKFGYVDTEYILSNIPDYKEAQGELDKLSIEWQKQLERQYSEIDKMYKNYQAEQILLTEDMKTKREEEIIKKEKEAKEYQKQKFGVDGELFKKRQELVKPIQDKVYQAVQDVANVSGLDIVFDKSSGLTMLYSNSKYNKSDAVLKKLGYTPGESK
ncbi:MAG: OmpH family outer membrane protein [Flavobacteriales bacterium]|nr:OmpH family outer membrane protein [Flavobacteriales bacterium]